MEEMTVSAKTVEDAVTEASVRFGVTSDKLEYEVIEKGSQGFLGIGMKQAVIKAKIKDIPKKTREVKEVKPVKGIKEVKENKKKNHPEKVSDKKIREKGTGEEPIKEKQFVLDKIEEPTVKASEEFLSKVLAAMNMKDVNIVSKIEEDGSLCVDMSGEDMGILIGKRGQTLDALQYLTNRVANKTQKGYVRIKLDTENYRKRRQDTLENLAKSIAGKVKRTKKTISLEPMMPYERRIIHSILQSDTRVTTHSEGQEPYRRVVVTPVRHRK